MTKSLFICTPKIDLIEQFLLKLDCVITNLCLLLPGKRDLHYRVTLDYFV